MEQLTLYHLGPSCKFAYLVRFGRHNTTDDGNGSDSESSQEKQTTAAASAPEKRHEQIIHISSNRWMTELMDWPSNLH